MSEREKRLDKVLRSDLLPHLRDLVAKFPSIAPLLKQHISIRLIVDANIVQKELQWRLRRRLKSDARTALHEAAVSGVVTLFAPRFLVDEIEEHLADIARRNGTTIEAARMEWDAFRTVLHLYATQSGRVTGHVVDPDDLPYVAACNELGAHAVYSMDKHLGQMKVPVVAIAIDGALREYARGASIRYAVVIGSSFSGVLAFATLKKILALAEKAFSAFRKLDSILQIGIVVATVVAISHPKVRAKLLDSWRTLREFGAPALELLVEIAETVQDSSTKLEASRKQIDAVLPPLRKRSALVHARAICLLQKGPISLVELEQQIKAEGYVSRTKDFSSYLRRVLRASGQFIEAGTGWSLRDTDAADPGLLVEAAHE